MSAKGCEADRMAAGNLGCGKSQALGCQLQSFFYTPIHPLGLGVWWAFAFWESTVWEKTYSRT